MKPPKKKAKALSIAVWKYLSEHPEIELKEDLPKSLFNKVRFYRAYCPLCALFRDENCEECPLEPHGACRINSPYYAWAFASSPYSTNMTEDEKKNTKIAAAKLIVEIVTKWDTK